MIKDKLDVSINCKFWWVYDTTRLRMALQFVEKSTSSWGSLYMICRGPMPSIIAWRCLFSIIFLGDSTPLHSSKELENMIKLGWCLHSEMLSFSPKTRLPIRIWKCFSWTKTQADLQPDVFGLSIHAEIHLIIKMDAIAIKYSITNPSRNSCLTWPNLLSSSYQPAPDSFSVRTAIVTDPITLHLHRVSQSYIVMVTYAESSNTCHTFYHSNSGIKYSGENILFDVVNFSFRATWIQSYFTALFHNWTYTVYCLLILLESLVRHFNVTLRLAPVARTPLTQS
jgi:hypothetical protein